MMPLFFTFILSVISGCSPNGNDTTPVAYRAVSAFPSLSFPRPVDLQHAGDNTNRIFVVEQAGVISVFSNNASAGSKKTFLDIKTKVNDSGNEEGLLGLVFHTAYPGTRFKQRWQIHSWWICPVGRCGLLAR